MAGISLGGIIVIAGIIVAIFWSLWLGIVIALIGLIFFGGLLIVAALGTILMDARKGANPDWARFAAVSSNVPFVAIAQGRNRVVWREIGWLRPAIGLAAFFLVLLVHP